MESITINNREVPFILKRSTRARRLRMQVDSEKRQIVMTIPRFTLNFEVNRFINNQKPWIEKQLSKIEKHNKTHPKPKYLNGDVFYYLGEAVTLELVPSSFWRPRINIRGDKMVMSIHREMTMSEGKKLIKKTIQSFYKNKAEEVIHDRLQFFNEYYQLEYKRVTLRNQKSRWGSCSGKKNLNFNWKLIMAPIEIIDYVVVHEMCHLKQMNHSAKFWNLVSLKIPYHNDAKKWLKENNYLLSA
ncbi:M48 family metallopeptidase [Candidatus Peregrinibacteria bacterium]|nr:M48 family metallopeptidase [Candidatus Peregrinibacteria bacterium]